MTEKFLKSKTHIAILGLCAISIILAIIYIITIIDNNKYNYSKPYNENETVQLVDITQFNDVDSRLEVGLNQANSPVFKNNGNAMSYLRENYTDTLELIKKEASLDNLTTETITEYIVAAVKTKASNDIEQERINFVCQFLLIYKNSFNMED